MPFLWVKVLIFQGSTHQNGVGSLSKLAFNRYQMRSAKGIQRYWLLMSLAHLIACTGCGESMPFEEGYAFISRRIQEERLFYIYQCGERHVHFKEVLALVA